MFVITIAVNAEGAWTLNTSATPGFAPPSLEGVAQTLRAAVATIEASASQPVDAPVAEPEA